MWKITYMRGVFNQQSSPAVIMHALRDCHSIWHCNVRYKDTTIADTLKWFYEWICEGHQHR